MVDFDLNDPDAVEHALRNRPWHERQVLTDAEAVGMSAASAGEFVPLGLLTGDATVGVLRILQEYKIIKALNARIKPRGWRRLWTLEHVVRAQIAIEVSEGFVLSKAASAVLLRNLHGKNRTDGNTEFSSFISMAVDQACAAIREREALRADTAFTLFIVDRRHLFLRGWLNGEIHFFRSGTAESLGATSTVVEPVPVAAAKISPDDFQEVMDAAVSISSVNIHQALHALTVRAKEAGR